MNVKYQSYVKSVFKDIEKAEKEVVKAASIHVRDKIKEKLTKSDMPSAAGQPPHIKSGNLRKGIKYQILDRDTAVVGAGSPAYHAHLLEFGTVERETKKGVKKGRVAARPFIIPTFTEEADTVKQIMSRQWL